MIDAAKNLLENATAITDVVADRIFPFIREEETPMPAIMLEIDEITPGDTNSGAKTMAYKINAVAYAPTAVLANGLMLNMRAALDRQEGDVVGYDVAHSYIDEMSMNVSKDGRIYVAVVTAIFHLKIT